MPSGDVSWRSFVGVRREELCCHGEEMCLHCVCMHIFDSVSVQTIWENTDGHPALRPEPSESKVSVEFSWLTLHVTVLLRKWSVLCESFGDRTACMKKYTIEAMRRKSRNIICKCILFVEGVSGVI
jgi:hypothetical protein